MFTFEPTVCKEVKWQNGWEATTRDHEVTQGLEAAATAPHLPSWGDEGSWHSALSPETEAASRSWAHYWMAAEETPGAAEAEREGETSWNSLFSRTPSVSPELPRGQSSHLAASQWHRNLYQPWMTHGKRVKNGPHAQQAQDMHESWEGFWVTTCWLLGSNCC